MDFIWYILGSCFPCFPSISAPHIKIKGSSYKIVRLLGEGGFSYVYLVQKSNGSLFALKKIRCPFGRQDETYKNALREIRNYHRFVSLKTPYIVQSIEECAVDELDGSKSIYIVMPYFEHSLQDIINSNVLNSIQMPEDEVLRIFIGICRGLQAMHKYRVYGRSTDDAEDDLLLPSMEGDIEDFETAAGADDADSGVDLDTEMLETFPIAHRDIKPANVMLSAEGLPVLVDLGSCSKARVAVRTRQQALSLTDFALQHCTLPYRAPELLDVATNTEITEATDVWSLGCLLYACCYGCLPFEKIEMEQGASLNLAISLGKYTIPRDSEYSEGLVGIIKDCLNLEAEKRPNVDKLLERALELQR